MLLEKSQMLSIIGRTSLMTLNFQSPGDWQVESYKDLIRFQFLQLVSECRRSNVPRNIRGEVSCISTSAFCLPLADLWWLSVVWVVAAVEVSSFCSMTVIALQACKAAIEVSLYLLQICRDVYSAEKCSSLE